MKTCFQLGAVTMLAALAPTAASTEPRADHRYQVCIAAQSGEVGASPGRQKGSGGIF